MIHKYLPVLLNWEEPHFVTLTVKAVSARSLKKTMERMNYGLNRIIGKYKKRNQRGKSERLIGIRSLECNFNPIARTYNPHFHLIVPNCKTGDLLIQEWLMTSRKGKTAPWAQKNLRVFNNEKCLIEIVKYGSKIFTEPDIDKKKDSSLETKIYARALYTIIEAMQGHRIFERFGFNLPKTKKPKSTEARLLTEFAEFNYDNSYLDWMNSNTNEQLTNYSAERKLNYLLEYNIDNELN